MTVFSMSRLVLDPADAADDVLGVVLLDHAAAGRHVAAADGREQFAERDAVGPQVFRPHVDLVFERHAADDRDLGDAGRGVELRGDVELVERPQPAGIDRLLRARARRVYQKIWPRAVASGARYGVDARAAGTCRPGPAARSRAGGRSRSRRRPRR